MMFIMALLLFGVVLALGGVTPELIAPSFFFGLLALVLWAGCLLLRKQATLKKAPTNLPALVFLGYALARYFTCSLEYEGRLEMFQLVLCVIVYFIFANEANTPARRKTVIVILASLAIFEAMYGLWQALSKSDAIFHWTRSLSYRGRASGTYICPNHLAGFLEMILGLLLVRLLIVKSEAAGVERSMLIKVGLAYAALAAAVGIAFTQSRGGWIAAAGGLTVLAFWGRRFSGRMVVGTILGACLIVGLVAALVASGPGWKRISSTFKHEKGTLQLTDPTLGGRLVMWEATVKLIQSSPAFGTGPGTWQWLFQKHKDPRLVSHSEYAHSDHLNLVSDYGIVGGIIVAWFFVGFFRHARLLGRKGDPPEQRAVAIGTAVAVSAILVHSCFDFNLHIPANAVVLAAIIGTMASIDESSSKYGPVLLGRAKFAVGILAIAAAVVAAYFFLPTVVSAHFSDVGKGFRRELNYDAAVYFQNKAVEVDPRAPQPYEGLGETYLVLASLRIGPDKKAERNDYALKAAEEFDEALQLNPYLTSSWLGQGRAYEMAGEDAKAIASYRKAVEVDPMNPSIHFRMGCFYRDRGDVANANREFELSDQLRGAGDEAGDYGPVLNLLDLRNR